MKYSELSDGKALDENKLLEVQEGIARAPHACDSGACASKVDNVAHLCQVGICKSAVDRVTVPVDPPEYCEFSITGCTTDIKSHT